MVILKHNCNQTVHNCTPTVHNCTQLYTTVHYPGEYKEVDDYDGTAQGEVDEGPRATC